MSSTAPEPVIEIEAQLVTGSVWLATFGKGRSTGRARFDGQRLTFIDKKGAVVLDQPVSEITGLDFKSMTGALIVSGDRTVRIYPPMQTTGSEAGDAIGTVTDAFSAASGVLSTRALHHAISLALQPND